MNLKEVVRLLLLQFTGIVSMIFGTSARAGYVTRFLQRITEPGAWDEVWGIAYPDGNVPAPAHSPAQAHDDPFAYVDQLAALSGRGAPNRAPVPGRLDATGGQRGVSGRLDPNPHAPKPAGPSAGGSDTPDPNGPGGPPSASP